MAVLIVLVMTVLDVTVVNVALPVMAREFGISGSLAVWIATIYQLMLTMLILPLSSAGDLFSYRRTFLTGVAIFTAASVMCAAAPSFKALLVARAIQGLGAACVMSVNVALTRLVYPPRYLGRGLALNGMVVACATAAGPTLAGAILSLASWHGLFLINIPFGFAAFWLGYRYLPANPPREKRPRYDWPSALGNILMFGFLFLAMGTYNPHGSTWRPTLLVAVALAVGALYIHRQRHQSEPMLPVDLFRIRTYTLSLVTSVCSFIAQMLAMVSLPFILLSGYGYSSITTGLLMTPWPVATMIVSPWSARFVERHNPGVTAAAGMAIFAAGLTSIILIPAGAITPWGIVWRMTVCGIGYGIFQTPNNIILVSSVPVKRTGGAGGMQSTARLVGQTSGATLVTTIFALMDTGIDTMVHTCLWLAVACSVCAAIFSLTRSPRHSQKCLLPE